MEGLYDEVVFVVDTFLKNKDNPDIVVGPPEHCCRETKYRMVFPLYNWDVLTEDMRVVLEAKGWDYVYTENNRRTYNAWITTTIEISK